MLKEATHYFNDFFMDLTLIITTTLFGTEKDINSMNLDFLANYGQPKIV